MRRQTIRIGGMTCEGCVRSVTNVLARIQGVRVERVDVGSATFDAEPSLDPARVREAIERAGFTIEG